jgi:hypothetical protein
MSGNADRATILRLLGDADRVGGLSGETASDAGDSETLQQADVSAGIAALLATAWRLASHNADEVTARAHFAALLRLFADGLDPPEQSEMS